MELTEDIGPYSVRVPVDDTTGVTLGEDWIQIDNEKMNPTSIEGNSFLVSRYRGNTAPAEHLAEAAVTVIPAEGMSGASAPLAFAENIYTGGNKTRGVATMGDVHADMKVTIEIATAHRVRITVNGSMGFDTQGQYVAFGIGVDGVDFPTRIGPRQINNVSWNVRPFTFSWITPVLAAGSHDLSLQCLSSGGTTTIEGSATVPLHMQAEELNIAA